MDLDPIIERMNSKLPQLQMVKAVVAFDLGAGETVVLDARSASPRILREGVEDADCTIKLTPDNLAKLMDGKLDPTLAYAMGKIKVSGSLGVALKLTSLIE